MKRSWNKIKVNKEIPKKKKQKINQIDEKTPTTEHVEEQQETMSDENEEYQVHILDFNIKTMIFTILCQMQKAKTAIALSVVNKEFFQVSKNLTFSWKNEKLGLPVFENLSFIQFAQLQKYTYSFYGQNVIESCISNGYYAAIQLLWPQLSAACSGADDLWRRQVDSGTCLSQACRVGHFKIAKYFIEQGVNIHFRKELCLQNAIEYQNYEIVDLLISKGSQINKSILENSLNKRDMQALKKTVELANPLNVPKLLDSVLRYSIVRSTADCTKFLLENGANININDGEPLLTAITASNFNAVYMLFTLGVNSNDHKFLLKAFSCDKPDIKIIKILIEKGANLHANDEECLSVAISKNNLSLVKYILKGDADLTARPFLFEAVDVPHNNTEIIECFLKISTLQTKNDALVCAVEKGNMDDIKFLLKNGVNQKFRNCRALRQAAKLGKLEIVQYFVENGSDIHAKNDDIVIKTTYNNRIDVLKYCLSQGCDINAQGREPFKNACRLGRYNIAKGLIFRRADIHFNNDEPLMLAIQFGSTGIVSALLSHGANAGTLDNLPICEATKKPNLEIIRYLVGAGADIEAQGGTPLINAIKLGKHRIVKFLIEKGVDLNANNHKPLKVAFEKKGKKKLNRLLIDAGATIN